MITKIGGGFQLWRQETVLMRPVLWMALGSLPVSLISARFLLTHVSDSPFIGNTLPTFLGVVFLILGIILLARAAGWPTSQRGASVRWPSSWALIVIGAIGSFLVGVTSGVGQLLWRCLSFSSSSLPINWLEWTYPTERF